MNTNITILDTEWHISYNEYVDETALVYNNTEFYILYGNHEQEFMQRYEQGGIDSCLEYYRNQKNNMYDDTYLYID